MMEVSHGSLFTGIGGFDDAASDLGIINKWNCECDKWLRSELHKKHPNAYQYADIQTMPPPPFVTIISAGFPCQDISICNPKGKKSEGIFGERSGLFFWAARIIAAARPEYVILENTPALLKRGMGEVLSTLSAIGYVCEWRCVQATDFGYPHRRRRLFIIAYPLRRGRRDPIFKPFGSFGLHRSWTPGKTFVHVSACRANGYRDITTIQRGDVVPNLNQYLHAYGNAVMPVMAEYAFRCILSHLGQR